MPVIAYQSFNSSANNTHDLHSLQNQRYTRETNAFVTGQGNQALVLPLADGNLVKPVQGPADLVPIEPIKPHTLSVFGSQIALVWQNLNRALGAMPAIMVCGEIDVSNAELLNLLPSEALLDEKNKTFKAEGISAKRACQSFSAVSQTHVTFQIKQLASGEGFVAYSVGGLNVVFVHVPNRVAVNPDKTQGFYKDIRNLPELNSRVIHLVIGDTNQPSSKYTEKALNAVYGEDVYRNALMLTSIEKYDNYEGSEKGTNSNGTKLYDIAVYRSDLAVIKKGPIYVSQSANAITVTDHCAVGLDIELKPKIATPADPAKLTGAKRKGPDLQPNQVKRLKTRT